MDVFVKGTLLFLALMLCLGLIFAAVNYLPAWALLLLFGWGFCIVLAAEWRANGN